MSGGGRSNPIILVMGEALVVVGTAARMSTNT
jgi:hypothetical protein